jgi:hypothetical protein
MPNTHILVDQIGEAIIVVRTEKVKYCVVQVFGGLFDVLGNKEEQL